MPYDPGPRYGIWSEQPEKASTAFDSFLESSKGVHQLLEDYNKNKLLTLSRKEAEQISPSWIEAEIFKNQITPDIERSKIGLTNAQAGVYGAHAGLLRKQSDQISSPEEIGVLFNKIKALREKTDPNSLDRQYYDGLLDRMITGGVVEGGVGTRGAKSSSLTGQLGSLGKQTAPQLGAGLESPEGNPLSTNPYTTSSRSMKGAQYSEVMPDGKIKVYTSPTQQQLSKLQDRTVAQMEANVMYPYFKNAFLPYQGLGAGLALNDDIFRYQAHGDKAAFNRLVNYEAANSLKSEYAVLNARQIGANQIGEELTERFTQQAFPNIPGNFFRHTLPADVIEAARGKRQEILEKMNKIAEQTAAQNFGVEVDKKPPWMTEPQLGPASALTKKQLDEMQGIGMPAQPQAQQQAAVDIQQLNAMAQDAIAKGADPRAVAARMAQLQGGQ